VNGDTFGLAETGNISCEGIVGVRRAIDDGHGATRDADEFVVLVTDLDVPDAGGASTMDRRGYSGQATVALGSQVIGIDLQAKGHLLLHVDVQRGTE